MASKIFQPSSANVIQPIMRRFINRNIPNQACPRAGNFSSLAPAADGWPRSNGMSHRNLRKNNGEKSPIAMVSLLPVRPALYHPIVSYANFSTAAMPQEEESELLQPSFTPTKKQRAPKRKPMRKRDPLLITPTAAARIQFLIDQHNSNGGDDAGNHAVGIRLGTKKRGCNGLSYTLNYAYENHLEKHARDEAMTIALGDSELPGDGLKVYVVPMALMNIIGTTMDFVDEMMSSEFTFTNPNSKGECGCGESFNV